MYSGEYDACDVTLSIVSVYKYSTNSMEITWFKSYDLLIIIIQCFSSDIAKYIEDIIHGGAKIWLLSSSGENNILRTSAASE